ncbi:hypothetical protein BDZ89DRAFT_799093 [Hymenopellis radicata]|nr:hypothetical protein BDZ89DRAFT_799093 [Hymenopellis radicata]
MPTPTIRIPKQEILEKRIFDMLTAAELMHPLLLPLIPQEEPGVRCLGRQCTRNLVVVLVSGAAAFAAVLLQTAVLGFAPPRSSSALDEGFHRYSLFGFAPEDDCCLRDAVMDVPLSRRNVWLCAGCRCCLCDGTWNQPRHTIGLRMLKY